MLRTAVNIQEDSSYEFNLSEMQKKLENKNYSGTITLQYQKGTLLFIREERVMRPGEYDLFI